MGQKIRSYVMPAAMLTGILFYPYLSLLGWITPYLVAIMLFISYSTISLNKIRITRLHLILLLIQIVGSAVLFLSMNIFNTVVAQAAMICVLAPTATSAIVITHILDGNEESLTTYSLLSNLVVILFAPFYFSYIGYKHDLSFTDSSLLIFGRVFTILLLPLFVAVLLRFILPSVHETVIKCRGISFYLWAVALVVVSARTVQFIMDQGSENYGTEILVGIVSLFVCAMQFFLGKRIGEKYNDRVAGGQGLGQKNTVLAIWMAQSFLNPISSIGPGLYIVWQNVINSYQVWKKANRE